MVRTVVEALEYYCLSTGFGLLMLGNALLSLLVLSTPLLAQEQASIPSVAQIDTLIRAHQYEGALQALGAALRTSPRDARLWTLEGITLSLSGRENEASSAFEKALIISPDNLAALRGEVEIRYQHHEVAAMPLLQRLIHLDPSDATAHEMLAMLDQEQGNCHAAVEQFLKSVPDVDNHPVSLAAYGHCLVTLDELPEAVQVFQQLATLLPQQTFPRYDLAVVLLQEKNYESAIRALGPLVADHPTDPDILSLASDAYEAAGDTPKAATLLRQAIVQRPADPNLYVAFAALCLSHESFQVGIDMLNAGMQRIANNPSLYLSRGLLYAELDDMDKAEADFDAAERLDPSQSLSSYAIDLAKLQKQEGAESATTLKDVRAQLKQYPNSPLLHFLLAKLLSSASGSPSNSNTQDAREALLTAIRIKPDFVEARDLLTNIDLRTGNYAQAVEQCRIALRYSPSDGSAMYHLIVALRHSGKKDQEPELQQMVQRLSTLERTSMQQETEKKRFRLVEQQQPPNP